MIKKILPGPGGTPFTPVAIERAVERDSRHQAGIYAKRRCENRVEVTREQIEESIAMLQDSAAYCAGHGYMVSTQLIPGPVPQQLPPAARRMDADMIVMSRSTRSLPVRRVPGDTVLNRLSQTQRPVFLSQ